MATKEGRIKEALTVLRSLGMPKAQQNDRSALSLMAILNLSPNKVWADASNPLMGITPIMDWIRANYKKSYAPNTRETIRRQTMHQFVEAGIALYNPDQPGRSVNSPHAVYQIEPQCLELLRKVGTGSFSAGLDRYLQRRETLTAKYAKNREMKMVPLKIGGKKVAALSPGKHSELIRDITKKFGPRFVPGGKLIYAGDTGDKWGYFDKAALAKLNVEVDNHGKMPDVVIYYPTKKWLILAEAVTSHGPVDPKRHAELSSLFKQCSVGLVFVSAFPDVRTFNKYIQNISWETEVWIAEHPSHLIHFNGTRFLGPYSDRAK